MKSMFADLKTSMKPMIKNALVSSGQIIGSRVGAGKVGGDIGARISRLIGSGDYESNSVATNSLIRGNGLNASSQFGQSSLQIRIKHREFLGDILSSTVAGEFTNYTYPINAGLRSTFPYLSQLASNYEEYCFKGLVFEFISTASPYLATSALGAAIAAIEYNSAAPIFTSKFAMENSAAAVSTRLDKNLMYGVECAANANAQNCYYIRNGASTLPLTTTDLGNFQFAVAPGSGVPVSSVLGELWVAYDVVLDRPILNMDDIGSYHTFRTGATSNLVMLGTAASYSRSSGSLSGTNVTSTTISPDSVNVGDSLIITMTWVGTAPSAFTAPAAPTVSGCVLQNLLVNNTTSTSQSPNNTVVAQFATASIAIRCTSTTPVITMNTVGVTLPSNATCEIQIVNLGNNLQVGTEW